VTRRAGIAERGRWLRQAYRRPVVWGPPLGLLVLAWYLAEVVEPWPEGPTLLVLKGLGPHGVATSDVILLAVLAGVVTAWLFVVSSPYFRARRRQQGVNSLLR